MGSAGNAHAFLGIKKKGFFNKMKSFFTRKEKQDGGNFLTDMLRPKSPLSSSSSSPSSPKPNTTKKNTMTMYHTSNYTSKNFETKDQFVKKQKWRGYLETLEKQIKNMSPEKRNEMKQSLHNQLNQNNKILNSMKKNLGSGAISEIQTRLSTIRSLLA